MFDPTSNGGSSISAPEGGGVAVGPAPVPGDVRPPSDAPRDVGGPVMGQRSKARDGLANRIEFYNLTHYKWLFWGPVQAVGFLRSIFNKFLINSAIYKMPTRPYALSTKSPYASWDSLTDRTYSSRHLPPVTPQGAPLPPAEEVAELFRRPKGVMEESPKSTVLFSYFAQWFTDGFLRTDRKDERKNTSNHDIDLSNLYGTKPRHTVALRSRVDGKLKSQVINGEEYPPFYYKDGRGDEDFAHLSLVPALPWLEQQMGRSPVDESLFATGGERVNSGPGFLAMNVLFLREHNRICDVLKRANPAWDDERLFQTARNVLIVVLLKIVIEEYINHIAPYHFQFRCQPGAFENQRWYRQNWMAVEFNLLYRWHSLVPDTYRIGGRDVPLAATLFANRLLVDRGLGGLLDDASRQGSGRIGLFNTPDGLLDVETKSIALGRLVGLDTYNAYRELCRFPRATSFDQLSGDRRIQEGLKSLYGSVDRIECYVGIFAEDYRPNSALPSLIGRLVGVDSFSQAMTNPLVAANLYNDRTFTRAGLEIIEATTSLSDVFHRNLPAGSPRFLVSMDRMDRMGRVAVEDGPGPPSGPS